MSKYKLGAAAGTLLSDAEATFYSAVDAAESARQIALVGSPTAAQARTANINYHRSIATAAAAAGNLPHLGGASRVALLDLTGGS